MVLYKVIEMREISGGYIFSLQVQVGLIFMEISEIAAAASAVADFPSKHQDVGGG
jgi:hypothetical protein